MAEKKIIAVTGATGAQGGGLVRAILADRNSEFKVRALTRNTNSEKALELRELGAEVVEADLDSEDSLVRAFNGAYGAFCVTFFWEHFSPERELTEAGNMARAAKMAALDHVIWSTLEDTRRWVPIEDNRMPTLNGKYKVPHFDAKGRADAIFTELGVPTTFLLTSFFWDNFIHFGMGPKPGPDGRLALTLPMDNKKLPGIASEDIGKCAYAIFKRGGEFIGKTVGIAGEHLSGPQLVEMLSLALNIPVQYNAISPEQYRALGFPGADDLGNMFQFKRDFEDYFCGARSVEFTRSINPELQDFNTWLGKNSSRIPIE